MNDFAAKSWFRNEFSTTFK